MLEAKLDHAIMFKRLLDSHRLTAILSDQRARNIHQLRLHRRRHQPPSDGQLARLVPVELDAVGSTKYRCDCPMPLSVNLGSWKKVLKRTKDDESVTLKAGMTLMC
ncbi:hypothetical protein FIBSPDRAFT_874808 [Athelia psychrophila]|uniref:Proliferating cell nuclear antigen PCNA N-terminal domain-containing protein n=1 Tax=Athelia psychrophila TaxID=1759441 RepID=A0A165X3F2_9AGAM|nr:hypothetical protein FIBSPDRAFT_874808 [Fibularhizoctonia sp. CBS 109695]